MLKVLYQKLRLKCKGGLNYNHSNLSKLQLKEARKLDKVGRTIVQGIPVLSIFALVGIISLGVMLPSNNLTRLFGIDKLLGIDKFFGLDSLLEDGDKAYAETYTASDGSGNSVVSLTIGGAGEAEQVAAGRGNTVYRTHTITLNADNIESYALTIAGNPNMTNPDASNTIDTITSTNGNVIGSNLVDNTWGYYYGEYNSTNGNSKETVVYQPLVSTGTTIDSGSPSNHTITNQIKNLVFAAKFGEDIIPGRYYANVDLSIVATPRTITYTLSYNANGGTGTVPSTQTMTTTSDSYEFTVANQGGLTKTGYSFLGWSESSVATSATYMAGSKITLSSTAPSRVLYAVWEKLPPFNGITNMQQMTATICKNAAIGDNAILTDIRDNSTYIVRKMPDSNCWMTQNLRLTKESMAMNNRTQLTSADSNIGAAYALPASSSVGFSDNAAVNVYYAGDVKKGAYYTYCAATAGSCPSADGRAPYSVCPRNWRLPTGDGVGSEYYALAGGQNLTLIQQTPYDFVENGYIYFSSPNINASSGAYWSANAYSSDNAYPFWFDISYYQPGTTNHRRLHGYGVRCMVSTK